MAEGAKEFELIYDGTGRSDILTYTATTNITKGLYYKFKVLAINAIGSSALSPELTSLAAAVPSTPINFTITSSASGVINLEWVAPLYDGGSVLTGYYVYYMASSATVYTKTSLISATSLSYSLGSLTADTLYSLKITAVNTKGESTASGILYQYASAVPATLAAPTVSSGSRTATTIGITWTAPGTSTTSVLGYRVYINDANSNADPSILVYDG